MEPSLTDQPLALASGASGGPCRQVEEALRRSDTLYHTIVSTSLDGCLLVAAHGRILEANDAYCQFSGYSRAELLSMTIADVEAAETPAETAAHLQQIVAAGGDRFESRHRRKDGQLLDVAVSVRYLPLSGGLFVSFLRDVTARKQAERVLRQERDRAQQYLDIAGTIILVVAANQKVQLINKKGSQVLGYAEADIIGKNWFDHFVPERYRVKARAGFNGLINGDIEPLEYLENVILTAAGEERIVAWHNTVLRDDQGGVIATLSSGGDISERKQAEEALRESEARFRITFENASIGKCLIDTDGRLIMVNRALCEMLGYSEQELIGAHVAALTHPDDLETSLSWLRRLLAGAEDAVRTEKRYIRKNGQVVWALVSTFLFRGANRKPLYFINHVNDITQRKQVEHELRRQEEEFRLIFEHSNDAIFWADAVTGVIINCNRKAEALTGRTRDELIGMHQTQLHPPEERERYADQFKQALTLPQVRDIEAEVCSRAGKRTPVMISTSVVNIGDRVIMQGVFHDITRRKQDEQQRLEMERRLLHAQKLESLGIMAGGIAHDFNNLLMAILGNLDVAVTDLSPVSSARSSIDQAIQAARRAADLTRQMLAYSGKGRFIVKSINLNEMITENAHLLKAVMPKTVTFSSHLDPGLPPIMADPGQVQQIIMNLLTNASESIGEAGGVVTLTTGVRTWDDACLERNMLEEKPAASRFVCLEVADTGCGMDKETRQRLFDPFFTTKFTGRGLGLSAVSGIVRGHQGAIFVDSEVGKGTTVRVLFPVVETDQPPAPEAADVMATPSGQARLATAGAVLVVDDEEMVRQLGKTMVERCGFQVLTAADGIEAVAIFQEHVEEIVCVLLDLTMPRMNGVDAFREMRRIRPGVKVILSSGYNEQEAIQQFASQGLAGFIQKPYRLQNLRAELERVAGRGTKAMG